MRHRPVLRLITFALALLFIYALPCSAVVYVKSDSPGPTFDGTSWAKAYHTVQAGLNAAAVGGEVWVASGTYVQRITLKSGVGLYGGFAGTETDRAQRNPTANPAILDGNQGGSVVTVPTGATTATVIDGFTIRNGTGKDMGQGRHIGGGVYCDHASPTISGNLITANTAAEGGGIYCSYSTGVIQDNRITANSAPMYVDPYGTDMPGYGGGIYLAYGSPTFRRNTVAGNTAPNGGGGGLISASSTATIADNSFLRNTAHDGGGIWVGGGTPAVSANVISGNAATGSGSASGGGGVYWAGPAGSLTGNRIIGNTSREKAGGVYVTNASVIANNIIADNSARGYGAGLMCYGSPVVANNTIARNLLSWSTSIEGGGFYIGSASITIVNNIVAFNTGGIYKPATFGNPVFKSNCVYGNSGYNYSGTGDLTGASGNISQDPMLAGAAYGNMHIQPTSLCRNAGDNSYVQPAWIDIDGSTRISGTSVDIGADESDGTTWTQGPYVVIRVSPTGDDSKDGSSWALAKRTVQAAIDAAVLQGGEVWVKAGTYAENIVLPPYAYLYGGFQGDETSMSARDWAANRSILDGSQAGSVVQTIAGSNAGTLDGFTVRNGRASTGGGVYCLRSSSRIANCLITANYAQNGCGLSIDGAAASILNNVIDANNASRDSGYGGGIYATHFDGVVAGNVVSKNDMAYPSCSGGGIYIDQGSPAITGNTLIGNTATWEPQAIRCTGTSTRISNNVVAFNGGGIKCDSWGVKPQLRNNCFYNPGGIGYTGLTAGVGDISVDPLLVNRLAGDYHLLAGSPCVNAGWSDAPGTQPVDMDFDARIYGTTVDIGADEWCQNVIALGIAKDQADGALAEIEGAVVTFVSGDTFYIEATDRSSGIQVRKAGHGLVVGAAVNVKGTMATSDTNGERYIAATQITPAGTASVEPILLPNRSVGGSDNSYNGATGAGQKGIAGAADLSNIGLLVGTTGKVTYVGADFFYLDDGSSLDDGSGHIGVKVNTEGLSMPALDSYVKVTGISSCYKSGTDLYRLLRARQIQ